MTTAQQTPQIPLAFAPPEDGHRAAQVEGVPILQLPLEGQPLPTDQSLQIRRAARDEADPDRKQQLLQSAAHLESRGLRELEVIDLDSGEGAKAIPIRRVSLYVGQKHTLPVNVLPTPEALQRLRRAGVAVEVWRLYAVSLPADANEGDLMLGRVRLQRGGEPQPVWLTTREVGEKEARGLRCQPYEEHWIEKTIEKTTEGTADEIEPIGPYATWRNSMERWTQTVKTSGKAGKSGPTRKTGKTSEADEAGKAEATP
jgi:hypothetical protein